MNIVTKITRGIKIGADRKNKNDNCQKDEEGEEGVNVMRYIQRIILYADAISSDLGQQMMLLQKYINLKYTAVQDNSFRLVNVIFLKASRGHYSLVFLVIYKVPDEVVLGTGSLLLDNVRR